jgi:mercuric ion binding protein
MNKRILALLSFVSLAAIGGALRAADPAVSPKGTGPVTVVLRNVHMCCGACVKDADQAVAAVPGAEALSDMYSKSVIVTASDHATAQRAVDALIEAGYNGVPADSSYTVKAAPALKDQQVTSLTLSGVHLCCKKCVSGATNALATVKGVKANTAAEDAATFDVTGEFNPNDVLAALNKAGFSGHVVAKP